MQYLRSFCNITRVAIINGADVMIQSPSRLRLLQLDALGLVRRCFCGLTKGTKKQMEKS